MRLYPELATYSTSRASITKSEDCERRLGRRSAIGDIVRGTTDATMVLVAPVRSGDDLKGAVAKTAIDLLSVGVVESPLSIQSQGPYHTLRQEPGDGSLRIDALDASLPGNEQMALRVRRAGKGAGHRLDPGGKGRHLSVGFETRDAGLLPAPSCDIVDEVETAFPVERHRPGCNARVQSRHGILQDVGLLQQRRPPDVGSRLPGPSTGARRRGGWHCRRIRDRR